MTMDPGGDRVVAGPAAGVGPGEVEEGRQYPQIGRREPGVGGDVVGDGGEGDADLVVLGPPGRLSPVRSAGPRPASSTGLWGSSRLFPLFPGVDPGLELGGGIRGAVRNSATRRAFSSGVGVPKHRGGAAVADEFSAKADSSPCLPRKVC